MSILTMSRRVGVALLLILVLTGCGLQLAYNYLDWALQWKVQGLVSLNSQQKTQTRDAIKRLHRWHRQTQLTQYAHFLATFQRDWLAGAMTPQYLHQQSDHIQNLLDQSLRQGIPEAVPIVASLDDTQIHELMDSFAEERTQYQEDYVDLTPAQRLRKRQKDLTAFLKDWLGFITPAQTLQIKRWSEQLATFEDLSLQQQQLWEQKMAELLAQRQSAQTLEKGLNELMIYRSDDWLPDLEKAVDENQIKTFNLMADMLMHLTPKQHQFLNQKLIEYQTALLELSNQKG